LRDTNEKSVDSHTNTLQRQRLGRRQMSDYKQKIRDVIFQAVEREIPIFEAATQIEAIIMKEIDGE